MRNKAFFFGDYQRLRQDQGRTVVATVPTAEMRRGNLTEFGTPIFDPLTRQPFAGNIIPADRIDPVTRQVADIWPLPNRPGLADNYIENNVVEQEQDAFDIRSDLNMERWGSVFGRYLFAVGKNEEAARYSGIRTDRIIIAAYVICCGLTAVAAIFIAMYTRSISPSSHGNFYELYAIAAAVLGGCSLRGGEGSILGVVLGTILLQVLQNLVNLLGIPSSLNFAVMGSVILIGVLADQQLSRSRFGAGVQAS